MTAADAPPAAPVRSGSAFGRALLWLAVVAATPAAALALCVGLIWHVRSQPAYGPAEACAGELTLAPGVRVEILPAHRSLQKARFLDFDVSPDGAIVVRVEDGLRDMAGGRRLGPGPGQGGAEVVSMAFAGPGLAVVTGDRRAGYWDDQGFAPVDLPGFTPAAVFANGAQDRLYLASDRGWSEGARWGLYSLTEGQPLRAETGSPAEITAATGDEVSTIFAAGGGLFRLLAPGQPVMLLKLPEGGEIVGLASVGGTVYFATRENTYALGRDMAVPVVLGLGGRLRYTPDGLLVLDNRRGRVFRIVIGQAK
jgi:hypothetical protein